jgi:serine/threonine-protein kinase
MLTGYRPFKGPNLIQQHLLVPPRSFAEANPASAVPAEVERVVLRCLAKHPDDRPASAARLIAEFRHALGRTPINGIGSITTEGPRPQSGDQPPQTVVEAEALAPSATRRGRRRASRWSRRIVMATAIGLGGLAVVAIKSSPRPSTIAGYRAEGPIESGRSHALVRDADGARFLWVEGGHLSSLISKTDRNVAGFYMQETEVTNAMLKAYLDATRVQEADRPARWKRACEIIDKKVDPGPYPAIGVPYEVAESYAKWAGGRLPSGDQWEYAARSGGRPNRYVWGDEPPKKRLANIDTAYVSFEFGLIQPKSYQHDRTEQGIFDLAGNVKEWVRYETDQGGPHSYRGGSFLSFCEASEVTTTGLADPDKKTETADDILQDGSARDLGFRIVVGD